MKKQSLPTAILAIFIILGLIACGEPAPAPTPTAIPGPPTTEVVTEIEVTATDVPPTNTAVPEAATAVPTTLPTDTPPAEPTEPATVAATEPISYTLTVDSPQPNQAITVGRDFTFSGSVSPVPSQRLEVELLTNGTSSKGDNVLAFADVDASVPAAGSSAPPSRLIAPGQPVHGGVGLSGGGHGRQDRGQDSGRDRVPWQGACPAAGRGKGQDGAEDSR